MWRLRLSEAPAAGAAVRALQMVPRAEELRVPGVYLRSASLHRRLRGGGYTMIGGRYGRALYRLACDVEERGVPGALVDCGVFNGGSTILLSSGAPSREAWAFDSFEGLPEPSSEDGEVSWEYVGECLGSEKKVRQGFREHADPNRLHIVQGWLEDTLAANADRVGPIAVLHVDTDWYEPVKLALETLYPQISPGGYVAVDDYKMWPGAKRAVDEFRAEHDIGSPLVSSHYWRKD